MRQQKKCKLCGAPIKPQYEICYHCKLSQSGYHTKRQLDEIYEDIYPAEISETGDCVMCGREWGTALRSDGRFYCPQCWAIWNS